MVDPHYVFSVLLVSFHHIHGPQVEYAFPHPSATASSADGSTADPSRKGGAVTLPDEWKHLPFLALPDGAHNYDEDTVCFTLPLPAKPTNGASHDFVAARDFLAEHSSSTVFGVACYRQTESASLIHRTADITRGAVQKSVCVLSYVPIFGYIKEKLGIITEALFNQKDFTDTAILQQFFQSINASLRNRIDESCLFLELSSRAVVQRLKHRTLVLYKALLLEAKIIAVGTPVDSLCFTLVSVAALMPGLLEFGLFHSANARLDTDIPAATSNSSFANSITSGILKPLSVAQKQRSVLLHRLALPLPVFAEKSLLQPYLSIMNMGVLHDNTMRTILAGVSNALLAQQAEKSVDVLVDLVQNKLDVKSTALKDALSLTVEDLRFINHVLETVDAFDKKTSGEMGFVWEGSDAWVRSQFEKYTVSLLATDMAARKTSDELSPQAFAIKEFGTSFVNAWRRTSNYSLWSAKVDMDVVDEPGVTTRHPFSGELNVADVAIRFNSYMNSLDPSIVEKGEKVSAAIGGMFSTVSKSISKAISSASAALAEDQSGGGRSDRTQQPQPLSQSQSQPQQPQQPQQPPAEQQQQQQSTRSIFGGAFQNVVSFLKTDATLQRLITGSSSSNSSSAEDVSAAPLGSPAASDSEQSQENPQSQQLQQKDAEIPVAL